MFKYIQKISMKIIIIIILINDINTITTQHIKETQVDLQQTIFKVTVHLSELFT